MTDALLEKHDRTMKELLKEGDVLKLVQGVRKLNLEIGVEMSARQADTVADCLREAPQVQMSSEAIALLFDMLAKQIRRLVR